MICRWSFFFFGTVLIRIFSELRGEGGGGAWPDHHPVPTTDSNAVRFLSLCRNASIAWAIDENEQSMHNISIFDFDRKILPLLLSSNKETNGIFLTFSKFRYIWYIRLDYLRLITDGIAIIIVTTFRMAMKNETYRKPKNQRNKASAIVNEIGSHAITSSPWNSFPILFFITFILLYWYECAVHKLGLLAPENILYESTIAK